MAHSPGDDLYWIIEKDDTAKLGSTHGMPRQEVEEVLAQLPSDGDYIIIRGRVVSTVHVLKIDNDDH